LAGPFMYIRYRTATKGGGQARHPQCIHSSPEGFGNHDLQCQNSGIKNEKVPAINITLQRAEEIDNSYIIFIFPNRVRLLLLSRNIRFGRN